MKNVIQIEVGDWSGDGHGYKDAYVFASNMNIQSVREAYWNAKEKYPEICPEEFCNEYEDAEVPNEIVAKAKSLGFKWRYDEAEAEAEGEDEPYLEFWPEDMADYMAWYCMLGNKDLTLIRLELPSLAFGGYDNKQRHIGFIGYGLY